MSSKRKPPTQPPENLSALARKTGVTRKTLATWRDEGVTLSDPKQLAARIEAMKKSAAPGSLAEAKLEKTLLECQKLRQQIEREGELWMRTEEVLRQCHTIGLMVKHRFSALAGTLPDRLAGCTATEIHQILQKTIDETLMQLSSEPLMPEHLESMRLQEKIKRHGKQD